MNVKKPQSLCLDRHYNAKLAIKSQIICTFGVFFTNTYLFGLFLGLPIVIKSNPVIGILCKQ